MKRKTSGKTSSLIVSKNHEAVWAGLRARGFEVHPSDGPGVAIRRPGNVTEQIVLLGKIADDTEVATTIEQVARLVTLAGEHVLCSCCQPGILEKLLGNTCDWEKAE